MSNIVPIAESIAHALSLLKGNPTRLNNRIARRNLKLAKKMYKQFEKDFSKDGVVDEQESALLKELKTNLVARTLELKS